MSNHVHLVAAAKDQNLSDILRDFKSYTAKLFRQAGEQNSNNSSYQFWQQYNQYKEVYSKAFAYQKFDYIHNNPVEAGLVDKAGEYVYSSGRDHHYGKNIGLLTIKFWDE